MFVKRTVIQLTVIIFFFLLLNLTYSQCWTQLTTTGSSPAARYAHKAIYDNYNNRMTIFGGIPHYNDIWVLKNANGLGGMPTWSQITVSGNIPAAREWNSAVYDEKNNCIIIYGGYASPNTYNDIWVLSHANGLGGTSVWTQITTTGTSAGARTRHAAVYDVANNRMIVMGGYSSFGNYIDDTWVLNNANGLDTTPSTWTKITATGTYPTARGYISSIYDATSNRLTVFGGDSPSGFLNDTWVLTNANGLDNTTSSWTRLTTMGSLPVGREVYSVTYDKDNNLMTVFGGYSGTYQNDIWVFNHANGLGGTPIWSQITTIGNAPIARYGHSVVQDTRNSMIIFGGISGTYLNDVWILDKANGIPTSVPKDIWELLD